jgi:Peptidase family C54
VAVLGGTGGGAPVLGIERYLAYFESDCEDGGDIGVSASPTTGLVPVNEPDDQEETAAVKSNDVLGIVNHPLSEEKKVKEAEKLENTADNDIHTGLLLLIPLVLGIGKLNPVYYPQLHAVLGMPHSVGIVGGRPGSSVYVVGCQGESLLYLDPHTIQPAATSKADWESFSCDVLRTMWLSSLDPSLALGFYCRNKKQYLDLCERLKTLEEVNRGMPLICVREGMGEAGEEGGNGEPQEWEEEEEEEEEEEDEDEEDLSEEKREDRFDEDELEGDVSGKEEQQEVEREDSEFSEVPMVVNGSGGRAVMEKDEEQDEVDEEEMQRRISELRQQSSKSVWELV